MLASMGKAFPGPVAGGLVTLLTDPDEAARERAVDTLSAIGDPVKPVLVKALESDDPLIWSGAMEALDRIGRPEKTVEGT